MLNIKNICWYGLLLGGILAGCQEEAVLPEEQTDKGDTGITGWTEQEVIPGKLRLTFRRTPEVRKALHRALIRKVGQSGLDRVDEVIRQFPGARLKRTIPYVERFAYGDSLWGFDMWYDLDFDESIPVQQVQEAFAGIAEVEKVSPERPVNIPRAAVLPLFQEMAFPRKTVETRAIKYPFNDPMLPTQWHYFGKGGDIIVAENSGINLFEAWKVTAGDPKVIVAIVDGGVKYDHPDLKANMWENPGEIPGNGIDDDNNGFVDDIYGWDFKYDRALSAEDHGTHVAGTVAAVNNNGIGVCGIAGGTGKGDGVRIMSCQIYAQGDKFMSNEPEAIIYAARHGAVIAQCSWGGYSPDERVEKAVQFFTDSAGTYRADSPMKGGLVICASANDGITTRAYPAAYKETIAVASINGERKRSSFSNYGDWIDITAPGGETSGPAISSTWSRSPFYNNEKGTSMACPHVSGVAALVVSKFGGPNFTNQELREILLRSVEDLSDTDPFYAPQMGRGLLRADLAVKDPDNIPPARVTDVQYERDGEGYRLVWSQVTDEGDGAAVLYRIYTYDQEPAVGVTAVTKAELKATGVEVGGRLTYSLPVPADSVSVLYYTVTALDSWGNESVASSPLAVNWKKAAIDADELRLYPLPFSQILTVEWGEHFTGNKQVSLYDGSGRRVWSTGLGEHSGSNRAELTVPGIAAGLYVLEFQAEGRTERRNVIKR